MGIGTVVLHAAGGYERSIIVVDRFHDSYGFSSCNRGQTALKEHAEYTERNTHAEGHG